MEILNRLYNLVGIAIVPEIKPEIHWRNKGWPIECLSWHDAQKIGYTAFEPPKICSECGCPSSVLVSDWWKIEDSGQYMVRTSYCPIGCGFTPWIA